MFSVGEPPPPAPAPSPAIPCATYQIRQGTRYRDDDRTCDCQRLPDRAPEGKRAEERGDHEKRSEEQPFTFREHHPTEENGRDDEPPALAVEQPQDEQDRGDGEEEVEQEIRFGNREPRAQARRGQQDQHEGPEDPGGGSLGQEARERPQESSAQKPVLEMQRVHVD